MVMPLNKTVAGIPFELEMDRLDTVFRFYNLFPVMDAVTT